MVSARDVVLLGGVLVAYALVSRLLSRTVVSAPMVFVAAGFVLGSEVLDLIEIEIGSSELRHLAEATLALLLFTDASALDTRRLEHELSMPERLLGLALPLTIVAGALLAWVMFPDLLFFEAVALAVLLAPTDAALGQAVVTDARLPSFVRQGLNVESGLNDGLCVPLLLTAIAFAEVETEPTFGSEVVVDLVEEVGIAIAVGVVVGAAIAMLLRRSIRRDLIIEHWAQIVPLAATAATYVVTVQLGGSGFIGSFVAGLVYGRLLGAVGFETTELTEDLGTLASAVTFFFFGAVLIGLGISGFSVEVVVYSVLSLTVIRMVPVALALLGTGARPPTVAFAGWFGPRGLATIVFALTVVEESGLPGTGRIVEVATVTVLLSVVAHGLTARPLTQRYVDWFDSNRDDLTCEIAPVRHVARARPARRALMPGGRSEPD